MIVGDFSSTLIPPIILHGVCLLAHICDVSNCCRYVLCIVMHKYANIYTESGMHMYINMCFLKHICF